MELQYAVLALTVFAALVWVVAYAVGTAPDREDNEEDRP